MHHKENIGHKAKKYTLQIFRFCLNILGEVITKTAATALLKLEPPSSNHTQARVNRIPTAQTEMRKPLLRTASKPSEKQQNCRLFAERRIVVMK